MDLRLEDRIVIAVCGPDARDFLQGLVTNDIRSIDSTSLSYAALLTPQGKILFDFLIGMTGETFLLDCDALSRADLLRRLGLYKLRAKIDLVARDDLAVAWRSAGPAGDPYRQDPRLETLGFRAIMPADVAPRENGARQYEAARLHVGVPEGRDFGQDRIFALDGDLDELHGIAFDKGCYVGQELTARMKHRGTARKRLLPISAGNGHALPAPGTLLTAGSLEIGAIQSSYGAKGFALVRLDRLAEAGAALVRADDTKVNVEKPGWLFA